MELIANVVGILGPPVAYCTAAIVDGCDIRHLLLPIASCTVAKVVA